jgi:hypothetical protein
MNIAEFERRLDAELRRRFMIQHGDICNVQEEFDGRGEETPEEIAKRLGDKYDLTDFTEETWLR